MKYVFLQIIVVVRFTGILCNGGEHHGDHGDHHHHGGGVPATEELTDLIQNFGLAVLGKDQESASDVQPTADHSHINVKVRPGKSWLDILQKACRRGPHVAILEGLMRKISISPVVNREV